MTNERREGFSYDFFKIFGALWVGASALSIGFISGSKCSQIKRACYVDVTCDKLPDVVYETYMGNGVLVGLENGTFLSLEKFLDNTEEDQVRAQKKEFREKVQSNLERLFEELK